MEDEESFSNGTALFFAVVSFVIYWVFLRPTATPVPPRPTPPTATSTPRTARPRTPRTPLVAERPTVMRMSEAAQEILHECQSKPNHVATSAAMTGLGGCNILLSESGLVAFSHTQASLVVPTDTNALRQDRVKILSRLCTGGNLPPTKGETVVVSVSQADLGESLLSKILYALGTFYNLVVIVAVDSEKAEVIEYLRQSELLSEEVLPSHRILRSSTVTGRVALVRQVNKVALVVDWDSEVESQLTRFGYKVALVSKWNKLIE